MKQTISRRNFLKKSGLVAGCLTLGIPTVSRATVATTAPTRSAEISIKNLQVALEEISKTAQILYRNCERNRLREKVTKMFPRYSELMSKGAEPDDNYLVALLDEEKSDLLNRSVVFEDVSFFPTEHAALRAIRSYDKQDRVAVHVGIYPK